MSKILLVDNYDSFTYNLVHYLEAEGRREIVVVKNDKLDTINIDDFDGVVISPGPGLPSESNELLTFLEKIIDQIPILGICLGLQAIAEVFEMKLTNLREVVHGQARKLFIQSKNSIIFKGIVSPTEVGRYHSWIISQEWINPNFSITAIDSEGNIMGIQHNNLPINAVQFHPESILTLEGRRMIFNWISSLN